MEEVPGRVPFPPLYLVSGEGWVAVGERGKEEEGDDERDEKERDQYMVEKLGWPGEPARVCGVCVCMCMCECVYIWCVCASFTCMCI